MTRWTRALVDDRALVAIFGDPLPSSSDVVVFDVLVDRDGPTVSVRFDLDEFPGDPPPKWVLARANTVQVKISLVGVDELSIEGVNTQLNCELRLEKSDHGVDLSLQGDGFLLRAHALAAVLDRVSAYQDSERGKR